MDKVLSKLGVTIERRSKTSAAASQPPKSFPNLPPGVTLQKKTDLVGGVVLPKGISVKQPNTPNAVEQPSLEEGEVNPQDLDEWPEDEDEFVEEEEEYVDDEFRCEKNDRSILDKAKTVLDSAMAMAGPSKTDASVLSQLSIPKGLTIEPPKRKVSETVLSQQSQKNGEQWEDENFEEYDEGLDEMEGQPGYDGDSQFSARNESGLSQVWNLPPTAFSSKPGGSQWGKGEDLSCKSSSSLPVGSHQPLKNIPALPQGVTFHKKQEGSILSNLNIPKGLTIQSPKGSSGSRQFNEEVPKRKMSDSGNYAEACRNTFKPEEQKAEDLTKGLVGLHKNVAVPFRSKGDGRFDHELTEEDSFEKQEYSLETSDEVVDSSDDTDFVEEKSAKPFIPPGITLGKSKPPAPKQSVSPVRTALPTLPRLTFPKPRVSTFPQHSSSPHIPPPRPRPVRNVTALPFNPFPPVIPRSKPSPVRAVAPRPARNVPNPPPTLITDFLEQQMQLGFQSQGVSTKKTEPKTLTPVKMNLSEANQILGQFLKKPAQSQVNSQRFDTVAPLQLPPGISVQSKKPAQNKLPSKVLGSPDANENTSNLALSKLPPGITLEKKKNPAPAPNYPSPSKEPPKSETATVPNVQLPPGITFQKKTANDSVSELPAVESEDNEHDDADFDESLVEEEEDLHSGDHFDGNSAAGNDPEEPADEAMEGDEESFEENQEFDEEHENLQEEENLGQSSGAEPQPDLNGEHRGEEDEDFGENENDSHEYDEDEGEDTINKADENEKEEAIDFENLISSNVITGDKVTENVPSHDEEQRNVEMEMDDKDVLQNIVDMVAKGEIEGEIQDDKEDGDEEDEEGKLGKRKSCAELGEMSSPKKMKQEEEDGDDHEGEEEDEDGEEIDKSKVTGSHLRKNIREVMDESKLDEATLAAQRQEAERLKRLQDQQRIIRDVQRQIQQSKLEKNQSKYFSLLQGNSQTSIHKTSSVAQPAASSSKSPSHVMLKMGNGQQTSLSDKMRELLKYPGRPSEQTETRDLLGMVGSSVTIAPVKKEPLDEEKKKKKGDVVTLSSDSDDDCIVLSDEEMESEPDEDPTNSGMHTNDRYNVPDEQGRVLVNTTHPPEEPDIFLAPQIAKVIKPHQIGGIRFLYDNIIESLDRYNRSAGFGCILAHSMGLGKTLQIVSFSDIFLRHTAAKKILCIMPINTIQNWLAEYNLWTPKEHADPEVRCRQFEIYVVNESLKNVHSRGRVILEWDKSGGVLLMGYELFRLLSLKKPIKSKRKRPDEVEEERNRELVEEIYRALVNPGPDLVICDEGHRIKNSHATTSQALKQIRTRRRVVLTGYPLQNNLLEYWCMVDFVRPIYLGSKAEFSNMFERPIQNGQCIDSTPQDKRLMRYRAHVLHSLLEGFVQRRSHAVLQQALPKKEEYVLMLRFTDFQKKLYDTFMNDVVRTVAVPNPLKAFAVCCKIWNHPDVLFNFMKKKEEQIDLDLEEALPPGGLPPRPLLEGGFGFGGLSGPNLRPTLPALAWPRRGPGSRGGKVRQPSKRKVTGPNNPPVPELPPPQKQQKPPENPLPSMSNFAVQSSPAFSNQSGSDPVPSPQGNFYQQPNDQQSKLPFQQQQQGNNYNSSTYNSSQHSMFTEQDLFVSNQQPGYGNNEFPSTFGSELDPNFYQGQQYQQTNVGNNPQYEGGNMERPYFNRNENSVSSGFDYNQSTPEFNQMQGFPGPEFDNANFDGGGNAGMDFPALPQQTLPQIDQQQQYWGSTWPSCSSGNYSGGSSGDEFMSPPKFPREKEEGFSTSGFAPPKMEGDEKKLSATPPQSTAPAFSTPTKSDQDEKKDDMKLETPKKDDVPYDWTVELFKNYVTGVIANSSKMEVFFLILNESIARHDRILLFSQSLLTLDLIEEFLQKRKVPGTQQHWGRNRSYFRLDGSTPALEREKLINEFNSNPNVHLFLVSTRAGSLGINLVGANRVIVFDASWNPCHDTQAVCRVYRYGQKKPCYVYRFVMDCCLEKKIYDRQINKQGMADRVVDELNPDAHLSIKEVTNLCWDDQEQTSVEDYSHLKEKYHDDIIKILIDKHSPQLSKAPFQHESLLIDRKEKKLSQAEKRLAKRSYELEKQAANTPKLNQFFPTARGFQKPIASVKPMQMDRFGAMPNRSKWIPAEVWQKQGMTAQEMTLPVDVVIPTNSADKTSIILNAGERVMVLKSPKGIYMQLQTGKIIAIRTAFKVGGQVAAEKPDEGKASQIATALKNNPNVTITHKTAPGPRVMKSPSLKQSSLDKRAAAVNMAATKGRIALINKAKSALSRPGLKITTKKNEAAKSDVDAKAGDETSELLKNLVGDARRKEDETKEVKDDKLASGFTLPSSTVSSLPLETSLPPQTVMDMRETSVTVAIAPGEQQIMSSALPTPQDMWNQPPKDTVNVVSAQSAKKNVEATENSGVVSKNMPYNFDSASSAPALKEEDVKKEEDPTRAWQGGYPNPPMDPYGNYYPGYYGYGHMPPYDPYHQPYPPHMPPVKQEAGADGSHATPPPAPHPYPPYPHRGYPLPHTKPESADAAIPPAPAPAPHPYPPYPPRAFPPAPHPAKPVIKQDGGDTSHVTPPPAPIYPPYPAPYPYPYNYPPYPPQAQPPAPTPAPAIKQESTETAPYTPPYGPRPPYPSAPAPPFYHNYPPYRPPYHDPNYPYPNYNPYMPPGYGYPMQGPVQHQIQHPQHGSDGSSAAPPSGESPN